MIFSLFILSISLSQVTPEYWTVDYLTPPEGAVLEVGGIGFMSDGDLIASTRRGQVWRIDNPSASNPADATFTLICEGLHEGLGLAVVDDEIFVMQRGEISKLVDLDDDTIIDEVQTITQDWGMSGNYHEFGFGLPADSAGNLYFSLNVGFWVARKITRPLPWLGVKGFSRRKRYANRRWFSFSSWVGVIR